MKRDSTERFPPTGPSPVVRTGLTGLFPRQWFDSKCQYKLDELVKHSNEWCSLFMQSWIGQPLWKKNGLAPTAIIHRVEAWRSLFLEVGRDSVGLVSTESLQCSLFFKVLLWLCRSWLSEYELQIIFSTKLPGVEHLESGTSASTWFKCHRCWRWSANLTLTLHRGPQQINWVCARYFLNSCQVKRNLPQTHVFKWMEVIWYHPPAGWAVTGSACLKFQHPVKEAGKQRHI